MVDLILFLYVENKDQKTTVVPTLTIGVNYFYWVIVIPSKHRFPWYNFYLIIG